MWLYILIAIVIAGFALIGFWASRQQKKRMKQAEEFYALPQIKALLDSGFTKSDDAITGFINGYPAGIYAWFEVDGPRYFTYLQCSGAGFSTVYSISEKYHTNERIRIKNGALEQELKQIDGDTLAKSFARLQEIAAIEKLGPVKA